MDFGPMVEVNGVMVYDMFADVHFGLPSVVDADADAEDKNPKPIHATRIYTINNELIYTQYLRWLAVNMNHVRANKFSNADHWATYDKSSMDMLSFMAQYVHPDSELQARVTVHYFRILYPKLFYIFVTYSIQETYEIPYFNRVLALAKQNIVEPTLLINDPTSDMIKICRFVADLDYLYNKLQVIIPQMGSLEEIVSAALSSERDKNSFFCIT